jgi:hypothetical protein
MKLFSENREELLASSNQPFRCAEVNYVIKWR